MILIFSINGCWCPTILINMVMRTSSILNLPIYQFNDVDWTWNGSLLLGVADKILNDRLCYTSALYRGWASLLMHLISSHIRPWESSLTLLANVITITGDTMTRDIHLNDRTAKLLCLHLFNSIRLNVRTVCTFLH